MQPFQSKTRILFHTKTQSHMTRPFFVKSFFAALLLAFTTLSLSAQTETAPVKRPKPTSTQGTKPAPARSAHPDEERGENYAKDLNLTEEQKAKFKKADEDFAAQRKAKKTANKEEAEAMRQARSKAHREALNADQLKKYDEMEAKRAARREANEKKRTEMKTAKKGEKAAKKGEKAEKKALKEELKKQ